MDVAQFEGRYLLDKAPGLSLLAVPVVAVLDLLVPGLPYSTLTWILTLLFAALPTLGFVLLASRFVGSWRPMLLVLASPWLVYAGIYFSHAAAAVLVGFGVVLALGRLDDEGEASWRLDRQAVLGGLALGGAVLVEYTSALAVVLVLLALAVDPRRRGRLLSVGLGGLGPALVLAAWNTVAFGGPLSLSYAHKANRTLAAVHAQGAYGISWPRPAALFGLLFGASRGLFFVAPWLIVGLFGALVAAADRGLTRAWRVLLVGGALGVPLALAGFHDWQGGLAFGPRYVLICLPVLGLGLHRLSERDGERVALLRWAIAGLVVSSFAVCALGAYVNPLLSEKLVNPIFEVSLPVLLTSGPLAAIVGGTVVTGLAAAVGLGLLIVALRPLGPARPVHVLVAFVAAIVHLVLAIQPTSPSMRAVWRDRAGLERYLGHEAAAQAAEHNASQAAP